MAFSLMSLDCRSLLAGSVHTFTFRQGKNGADKLAKVGVKSSTAFVFFRYPTPPLKSLKVLG